MMFSAAVGFWLDSRGQLTTARTYNAEDASAGPNRFAEFVQYHPDRMIKSLTRYDGYGVCTDSLAFPNNDRPGYLYDCKEGEPRQCAFEYDLTGNTTYDTYNDLQIRYNFLNLPSSARSRDFYTYLADGTKCAVIGDYDAGFDYIGSLLYLKMEEDTVLESAAFGSGRIVATDQSTVPHYYLCDHLGSTRAIVTETGVTETYDYYPYGLTWQQAELPIGSNTYLFTGKEWQAQDGVDLYDFGARFYQPRFGKWLSFDPLAEKYMGISPYAYCGNDPVNRVDPDGRKVRVLINDQSQTITIAANIYLTSPYYTQSELKTIAGIYQRDILNAWDQNWTYRNRDTEYQVRFDVNVKVGSEKKQSSSYDNFIEVQNNVSFRPYVDPSTYNGKWIVDGKVAAHEFGHIAGLQDQYVDKEENGQTQSIPNQGWDSNIMGSVKKGAVDQRNIDDILKRPFEHYNDIKDSWWKSWFDSSNSYLIQTIDK